MCRKSRRPGNGARTMLLVLVFCLAGCYSYADVLLTDEEVIQLRTSLTEARSSLERQRTRIQSLEESLKNAKTLQMESQMTIEMQKQELTRLSESLQKQKKEQRTRKIAGVVQSILVCAATGLVGYSIGATR